MSEKDIEKSMIHYLAMLGFAPTPNQSGKLRVSTEGNGGKPRWVILGPEGTEDISCCANGKFVAIEVKKNKKEVEKWYKYPLGLKGKPVVFNKRIDAQQRRREDVLSAGGIFIVSYSIDDLKSDLERYNLI